MDPIRKVAKKFTKKFGNKVINRQYFRRKTGLQCPWLIQYLQQSFLSRLFSFAYQIPNGEAATTVNPLTFTAVQDNIAIGNGGRFCGRSLNPADNVVNSATVCCKSTINLQKFNYFN